LAQGLWLEPYWDSLHCFVMALGLAVECSAVVEKVPVFPEMYSLLLPQRELK
jgi:hypothetical protein